MGYFSWKFADTDNKKRLKIDNRGYLFLPDGGVLQEDCYDGYGRFAGYDVYALVADWNREFLAAHPDFVVPRRGPVSGLDWYRFYADLSLSAEDIEEKMKSECKFFEYRCIGIDIACYNEQNASLPFPIKIASKRRGLTYEALPPSKSDPDQGI